MKKMRLLALLLALMLLAGCAAKDTAVIVDVNGETVNKAAITLQIDNEIAYNEQMNAMYMAYYGVNANLPTDRDQVAEQVITSNVNQLVAMQKAKELGLDQLTAEEAEETALYAKEAYEQQIANVIENMYADLSEEEAREKAVEYAAKYDVTEEIFIKSQTHNTIINKLTDYVIKDATVTDEEVTEQLNQKIEEEKAACQEDPNAFGDALNTGSMAYYAPAGYRLIKHIVLTYSEEDQADITEKQDLLISAAAQVGTASEADKPALQEAMDAAQADLDAAKAAAVAKVKPLAEEIYAKALAEDADFDALMAEYSVDTAAPKNGYAIREGYTNFAEDFYNAAMAMENVGDIAPLVETDYGFHIIQYVANVAEGPYEIEAAHAALTAQLLSEKQKNIFNDQMTAWIAEAAIKTYPERLK